MKKIRRGGFFPLFAPPRGATSFVRSTTSFAAGNFICTKCNIMRPSGAGRRQAYFSEKV